MQLTSPPVFRFAPSPNGQLHLGHAYSALLNATLASRFGGRFLLRIEDIDVTRCTRQYADQCIEDLHWLGLTWEAPVRVQSEHWDDYAKALASLKERGLIYPCFCSRRDIARISRMTDPDGAPIYPGTCKHLPSEEMEKRMAAGEPHSWRLDMARALLASPGPHGYARFTLPDTLMHNVIADPMRWGDVILARKETPTSYHLSVVVDDALQQVTHVVRGTDLKASTCLHVLLQSLLGLSTPLYHHHDLITEAMGDKLSKSKKSEPIAELRQRGVSPLDIRQMLGF